LAADILALIASLAICSLDLQVEFLLFRVHTPRSMSVRDGNRQIRRVKYPNSKVFNFLRSHQLKQVFAHVHPPRQ